MDIRLKKFISKIIIFSLILILLSFGLFATVLNQYYFQAFPMLFVIFISLSVIVHSMLLKASKKRPMRFSTDFMLATMLKLFIYSSFVGIFIYFDRESMKPFVISFMAMYFAYTFFEIKILLTDIDEKRKEL